MVKKLDSLYVGALCGVVLTGFAFGCFIITRDDYGHGLRDGIAQEHHRVEELRAEQQLDRKTCDQRVVRARTETREIYDHLRVSWQTDTAHLRRDWGACENELEACRRARTR